MIQPALFLKVQATCTFFQVQTWISPAKHCKICRLQPGKIYRLTEPSKKGQVGSFYRYRLIPQQKTWIRQRTWQYRLASSRHKRLERLQICCTIKLFLWKLDILSISNITFSGQLLSAQLFFWIEQKFVSKKTRLVLNYGFLTNAPLHRLLELHIRRNLSFLTLKSTWLLGAPYWKEKALQHQEKCSKNNS